MYGSMNASTHQSHVLWGLHAQSGAREGTRCLPQAPERERGACLLPLLTKRDMRCDPAEELADRDSGRSCDLSDASEPAREWLRDSADGLTGREQRPRAPVRTPRTPAGALLGAASQWRAPRFPHDPAPEVLQDQSPAAGLACHGAVSPIATDPGFCGRDACDPTRRPDRVARGTTRLRASATPTPRSAYTRSIRCTRAGA